MAAAAAAALPVMVRQLLFFHGLFYFVFHYICCVVMLGYNFFCFALEQSSSATLMHGEFNSNFSSRFINVV
jgi:hypothetical protein